MELDYLDRLHQPGAVALMIALLAAPLSIGTSLVTYLWRPGIALRAKVGGVVQRIPLAKRLTNRSLSILVVLVAVAGAWRNLPVLEELETLPGGAWVATAALLLGVALGLLSGTARPTLGHTLFACGTVVVAVIVAVRFSAQFAGPVADATRPGMPGAGVLLPAWSVAGPALAIGAPIALDRWRRTYGADSPRRSFLRASENAASQQIAEELRGQLADQLLGCLATTPHLLDRVRVATSRVAELQELACRMLAAQVLRMDRSGEPVWRPARSEEAERERKALWELVHAHPDVIVLVGQMLRD